MYFTWFTMPMSHIAIVLIRTGVLLLYIIVNYQRFKRTRLIIIIVYL